jgi:hypothetical protein
LSGLLSSKTGDVVPRHAFIPWCSSMHVMRGFQGTLLQDEEGAPG